MNHSVKTEIQECEEQLKKAMLQSDVAALDELLAPDLIFTNHLGHIVTKQDDLEAHKSKLLKINEITLSDQHIKTYENIAIVTVKARIAGSFKGNESANYFRFTRVWSKISNKTWHITAGHSSLVN